MKNGIMLNTNKKTIFCVSISKDPVDSTAYLMCSISKNSKFEGIDFEHIKNIS